jgi:hypothetical protein
MTLPLVTGTVTHIAIRIARHRLRAFGVSLPRAGTALSLSPQRARAASPLLSLLLLLGIGLAAQPASAISCTAQSQIAVPVRTELASAVARLASYAIAGDTASLKASTLASVAAQFDGIAATVDSLAPLLKGAELSIQNLYMLHAEDLKAGEDEAQFFCSVPGSSLLVTITIPQLPPGGYALAIVHATGVAKPQQMGMILARSPEAKSTAGLLMPGWMLAGFFARPLTIAGHDGVWYWSRARELAKAQQRWSAYFYYQSAQFLLTPVDFLASPNLAKLDREAAAVRPDGIPTGDAAGPPTMTLTAGDENFTINNLRTDGALGGLDLVVHYNANAGSVDPVFARSQAVDLMQAMLKQHPELRANFHGLWVYADSPGHQSFAVELPMDQIQ